MSSLRTNATFDLIERIDKAQTPEDLIALLAKAAEQFGFQAAAIAAFPLPDIPFEERVLVQRWPNGWFDHYMERNYVEVDPVFHHSKTSLRPFEWSEARYEKKSKAAQVMNEAAEFGLPSGFCVPTNTRFGPINVTFGGRGSEMSSDDRKMLHLVAMYAQLRATELLSKKLSEVAEILHLSPREQEVLQWCAEGKTSERIAEALGISAHTVETHISGACRKLGARSRTAAVAKAMHAGLIRLTP